MNMSAQVGQATVFLPLLAVVALSVIAFIRLAIVRVGAIMRREAKLSYYRAFQGTPEPEYAAATARHYNNLFEAPVIFYLACVVAFEIGAVTPWLLVFAWGYAAMRVVQSTIHLTGNNVPHRARAFFAGWVFLILLWADVAVSVLQQV